MQEEEVLGKAYDGRLMKRLLGYLRPYKWRAGIALLSIILKVFLGPDVIGPLLTSTTIHRYLTHGGLRYRFLDRWLSTTPYTGIAQIPLVYMGCLLFTFVREFVQTYL